MAEAIARPAVLCGLFVGGLQEGIASNQPEMEVISAGPSSAQFRSSISSSSASAPKLLHVILVHHVMDPCLGMPK